MGVQLSKTSHQIIFLGIIPVLSVLFTLALNSLLQKYIQMPWVLLIDSVSVLGIYTVLFRIFNDFLWQTLPKGMFGIVDVPNLNGSWKGELKSSYNNNTTPFSVRVEILQTFSNIKIFAYFKRSWSYSIVAGFYKESDGRQVLHYVYRNEPRNSAANTMHGHYGAGKHEYMKSKDIMECSYYNEPPRDRGRYGKFNVRRKKRTLIEYILPSLKSEFR